MTLRLALLASGAGTTATAVMDACRAGTVPGDVVVLLGNNSGAPAFTRAVERGVPTRHLSGVTHPDPDSLDTAVLETLRAHDATHVVLAGYMKKLGPRTLAAFEGRILNTHPALLSAHGGQFGGQGMYGDKVHRAVLDLGVPTTGASVHVVTAGYDEGPVLAEVEVPVAPGDDVETLGARVRAAEKRILIATLLDL